MDTTTYTCRKQRRGKYGLKCCCKWNGVLSELTDHMITNHPESYFDFTTEHNKTFDWNLPYTGKQMDICLLRYNKASYLYQINYDDTTNIMQHIIQNISDVTTPTKFILCNGTAQFEFTNIGCFYRKDIICYKVSERNICWKLWVTA